MTKSDRVAFRETKDGGVLLHLESGQYHGVNSLGALIWSMVDGRTVDEIVAEVTERFEDAPTDVADHVRGFLSDLAERDLVTSRAE